MKEKEDCCILKYNKSHENSFIVLSVDKSSKVDSQTDENTYPQLDFLHLLTVFHTSLLHFQELKLHENSLSFNRFLISACQQMMLTHQNDAPLCGGKREKLR